MTDEHRAGRRETDADLNRISGQLDRIATLLEKQIALQEKQTAQNVRAADMLRDELQENRKMGRQLAAVLIDAQLERAHQRSDPEREARLLSLVEQLAAVSG